MQTTISSPSTVLFRILFPAIIAVVTAGILILLSRFFPGIGSLVYTLVLIVLVNIACIISWPYITSGKVFAEGETITHAGFTGKKTQIALADISKVTISSMPLWVAPRITVEYWKTPNRLSRLHFIPAKDFDPGMLKAAGHKPQ